MAIVTTLYDLVDSVSEDCSDSEKIASIIEDIVNTGKVVTVKSSQKIRIVPQAPVAQEAFLLSNIA